MRKSFIEGYMSGSFWAGITGIFIVKYIELKAFSHLSGGESLEKFWLSYLVCILFMIVPFVYFKGLKFC